MASVSAQWLYPDRRPAFSGDRRGFSGIAVTLRNTLLWNACNTGHQDSISATLTVFLRLLTGIRRGERPLRR